MNTSIEIVLQWGPHHTPHGPMGPYGGPGGGFGFLWGPLFLLLFAILIIGGAFLALNLMRETKRDTASEDAVAILERRYARGEIDEEEFEKRRTRLNRK